MSVCWNPETLRIKPMKLIYTHENRLFVANIQNLLEQASIVSIWKNEHASSAIGELAPISAWPELWLVNDNDYDRAYAIIQAALAQHNLPEWICTRCKEINDPAFDYCWNCQLEKPGLAP